MSEVLSKYGVPAVLGFVSGIIVSIYREGGRFFLPDEERGLEETRSAIIVGTLNKGFFGALMGMTSYEIAPLIFPQLAESIVTVPILVGAYADKILKQLEPREEE